MAAAKRAHDVISIHSDSEDDLDRLARPPKLARQNEAHLARNYYQSPRFRWQPDNMEGLMRTGVVLKDERSASPQAEPDALATTPQTIDSSDSDHEIDPPFQVTSKHLPVAHDEEIPGSQDEPIVIADSAPTPERSLFDQVLEIVPDVCRDHVTRLIDNHHRNLEQVMETLFSGDYPKESEKHAAEEAAKQAALRDQKSAEEAEKLNLLNPNCIFSGRMKDVIIDVLKDEFSTIPVKYIKEVQKEKKHLYATYLALNEAKHADVRPFGKTPWRPLKNVDFDLLQATKDRRANIPVLKEHLEAARQAAVDWNLQRRKNIAKKKKDEEEAAARAREDEKNLEQAKASGTIVKCDTCWDEYPPNRVVRCGSDKHSVCFECMRNFLESEVGQSSFKLACPGKCDESCDDTFREPQLRLVPGADALIDEIMRLRQEHDLRTAGIDDVGGCPFCDFKTVCRPIEVDFEFHCQSPSCSITSCRKCKEKTHIPESCEEHQRKRSKDVALSHRHRIEEARSKALIRNCNKCKRASIKSDGCNKMTCPSCGNLQCYVCGEDVTANYSHFQEPNPCPTYEINTTLDEIHAQEVKAAAEAAQAEVLRQHPELDKEHLAIRFSDNVAGAENRLHLPPEAVQLADGLGARRVNLPGIDQVVFDDPNELLYRGEMAQHRRRAFAREPVQGPRAVDFLALRRPAPVRRQIIPLDHFALAAAALEDLPDPVLANHGNAHQPFDLPYNEPDPALGQFDFGIANKPEHEDPYGMGQMRQPQAPAMPVQQNPHIMEGMGGVVRQRFANAWGPRWAMNNRVQQPQANAAPHVRALAPAPAPVPAPGAHDNNQDAHHHDQNMEYAYNGQRYWDL